MTIYFSSNTIKALQSFDLKQRRQLLSLAENKFTVPQRFILNMIKLSILVPMFLYVIWLHGWLIIMPPFIAFCIYMLIYRPIWLFFINKHIDKVINNINK